MEDSMLLFRWQFVADFIVLAVALYILLRWAKRAQATRLALGILGLHAAAVSSRYLDLFLTSWVLDAAAIVAVLALLVIFHAEVRRAFLRLDTLLRLRTRQKRTAGSVHRTIADTAFRLAAKRTGALLVLVRNDSITELMDGTIELAANISPEILEAIFQKNSPLHDGAAVIDGDQIVYANAVLPLTQRADLPIMYGTRHRAAIGLTERSDAIVIAVSEERGDVSLVRHGEVLPMNDAGDLRFRLQAADGKPPARVTSRLRRAFTSNLRLKFAAGGIAAVLWILSVYATGTTLRTIRVPVEFRNVPNGMNVIAQSAESIDVQLRGRAWLMDTEGVRSLVAQFDLSKAQPGPLSLLIGAEQLDLPPGVELETVTPRVLSVMMERRREPRP